MSRINSRVTWRFVILKFSFLLTCSYGPTVFVLPISDALDEPLLASTPSW